MFKVVLLTVALVAYVSCAPADEKKTCAGCPVEHDVNDTEILKKMTGALSKANSNSKVKKIISYKTQVVAGTKYIIEYLTTDDKTCKMSFIEQPWLTGDKPQFIKNDC